MVPFRGEGRRQVSRKWEEVRGFGTSLAATTGSLRSVRDVSRFFFAISGNPRATGPGPAKLIYEYGSASPQFKRTNSGDSEGNAPCMPDTEASRPPPPGEGDGRTAVAAPRGKYCFARNSPAVNRRRFYFHFPLIACNFPAAAAGNKVPVYPGKNHRPRGWPDPGSLISGSHRRSFLLPAEKLRKRHRQPVKNATKTVIKDSVRVPAPENYRLRPLRPSPSRSPRERPTLTEHTLRWKRKSSS